MSEANAEARAAAANNQGQAGTPAPAQRRTTDQNVDPNVEEIPRPVFDNEGPRNTEEARRQSAEVLRRQEEMRPQPSQEEADAIRLGQRQVGGENNEITRRGGRDRSE